MAFHVYAFLFVVCLFLLLALFLRHDLLYLQPGSSQGEARRSTLHRLLKPRCPDNCPCTGYVRHVTHDEIADAVG